MQKLLQQINYPLASVLICLCLYGLFTILFMEKNGKDASYFIHAGDTFVNERLLTDPISVLPNSHGYDGQFYYRLTLNPFTNKRVAEGIMLDNPHYRQQRIMYPLLTSFVAFNTKYIPEIMIGINLLFLGIITFYGSKIAVNFNKHTLWGIIFVLWPGFFFTISRNLTEIVAGGFLIAGIYYFLKKKHIISTLLFSFAVLTKETALIVPVSIVITSVGYYIKDKKSINILYTLPFFIYGFWQLWLNWNWTNNWSIEIGNNIGFPFKGIIEFIKHIPFLPNILRITSIIELVYFIILIVSIAFVLPKSKKIGFAITAWIIYVLLTINLTYTVWVEDIAFMRATTELFTLGMIILLNAKSNSYRFIFPIIMVIWSYMFLDILQFR